MSSRFFHAGVTAIYASLLMAVYVLEISDRWSYMGFQNIDSVLSAVIAVIAPALIALFIPYRLDTRSILLSIIHYIWIIPYFIVLASEKWNFDFLGAFSLSIFLLFSISSVPLRAFRIPRISRKHFFISIVALLSINVILMTVYGGLSNFNLNILRVYEFRNEAASSMPDIFAYIFSGVSKVVAPISLAIALYYRSYSLFFTLSLLIILLFGITSHKSVIILPMAVAIIYIFIQRGRNISEIAFMFLGVGVISILEIVYIIAIDNTATPWFNALIVRRAFFVPPLMDSLHLEFFSENAKYYWSTSRFSFRLSSNPYDLAAPFLIGREFFGRETMSANTGIIGSGFSQAGYIGIAIYASLTGLFLSFLQAYGRIIGHAMVSAASLSVFISVVTSTDLLTAILTHGLLLLIVLLIVFPKQPGPAIMTSMDKNDHSLHHRSPAH